MVNIKKSYPSKGTVSRKAHSAVKAKASRPGINKGSKYHLNLLLPAAIILYTFILFYPSLKNDFVNWDDKEFIHKDKVIQQLKWENVKEIWTTFNYDNYHPLTTLSHALEYSFVKTKSAFLYHFDNLILHLLNILLVFFLFRLITRNDWLAALVALLFAIHPMHVESVVWAAERKDVLYSFFFLISLIFYCKYLKIDPFRENKTAVVISGGYGYLALALLFFLLSLLSKSAAVILPLVMVLLDFFNRRKFNLRTILEKLPFFALSVLFGIIAILSQHHAIQKELDYTLIQRVFLVNFAILRYVVMMFFPVGLSAFHPYPEIRQGFNAYVHLSPIINLTILGLAIYSLRFSRVIFFGLAFFIVNLLLVLQILPVGGAIISERYTYIPYLGLFFILAYYLTSYLKKKNANPALKTFLYVICGGYLLIFTIITSGRTLIWKDSVTLWTDANEKYPNTHHLTVFMLGNAYKELGEFDKALPLFNQSIAMKPDNTAVLINRGNLLFQIGRYDDAYKDFDQAIKYDSTLHEAYNNRGVLKGRNHDFAGSMIDLNRAVNLKKDYSDAYRNRGVTRMLMGDRDGALSDWLISLKLGDDEAKTLYNQALTDTIKGRKYNLDVHVKD